MGATSTLSWSACAFVIAPLPGWCICVAEEGRAPVALATRDKGLQLIACGRAVALLAIRLNLCDCVKST